MIQVSNIASCLQGRMLQGRLRRWQMDLPCWITSSLHHPVGWGGPWWLQPFVGWHASCSLDYFSKDFICPWHTFSWAHAFHVILMALDWLLKITKTRFRRERLSPRRQPRAWCLRSGSPGLKMDCREDGLGLSHWPDALPFLMGWRWRWHSQTSSRTNTVARPTRTQMTWSLPNMRIAPGKFSTPAHSRTMGKSRRSISSSSGSGSRRRRRRARAFPPGWCP